MTSEDKKPVWFITGCSTGFGHAIATHTLGLGYPTVITGRKIAQIEDLLVGHEDHALVLELDVTKPQQIAAAVATAEAKFGRIDVLVNNAGVGYFGSLEESKMEAVRSMFEINMWGLAEMTRAVLPGMRERRAGAIVNLSAIGGIAAFPAPSFYNASKFAVEALSESLALEVAPMDIKVLLVEPGPSRTNWAGRSADQAPQTIADYHGTVNARTDAIRTYSGKQPGPCGRGDREGRRSGEHAAALIAGQRRAGDSHRQGRSAAQELRRVGRPHGKCRFPDRVIRHG